MKQKTIKKSATKKKLFALQKKGFLFHGSPFRIDKLELRQPSNFNIKKNKYVKHGKHCVAATPFADIAIFRAIINKTHFPPKGKDYAAQFGIKSKKINLATTKKVLQKLSNQFGYVHVFDKKQFSRRSVWEWRSYKEIKPLKVIKVTVGDLNDNIKVIDYDFNLIKD